MSINFLQGVFANVSAIQGHAGFRAGRRWRWSSRTCSWLEGIHMLPYSLLISSKIKYSTGSLGSYEGIRARRFAEKF